MPGPRSCRPVLIDGSGATVTAGCRYTAGNADGTDVVLVTDGAGYTAESTITVASDATLDPEEFQQFAVAVLDKYMPGFMDSATSSPKQDVLVYG